MVVLGAVLTGIGGTWLARADRSIPGFVDSLVRMFTIIRWGNPDSRKASKTTAFTLVVIGVLFVAVGSVVFLS